MHTIKRTLAAALLAPFFTTLVACGEGGGGEDRSAKYFKAACKVDDDCAKDNVCKKNEKGEGTCEKGERSAADEAARKKAEIEARKAKEEAKKQTKPGEGRLEMRVCPVFKNTPEAIGTITAKHIESGKEHFIHMAQVVVDGGWEDQFTFWSLPLGKYEVKASYGIQVRGRAEVVDIKCHEKIKKDECKDEVIRLVEVVLPEQMPPPEKDKDGKVLKKPCDWLAE